MSDVKRSRRRVGLFKWGVMRMMAMFLIRTKAARIVYTFIFGGSIRIYIMCMIYIYHGIYVHTIVASFAKKDSGMRLGWGSEMRCV